MAHFILYLILWGSQSGGPTTLKFKNLQECERTLEVLKSAVKPRRIYKAGCLKVTAV